MMVAHVHGQMNKVSGTVDYEPGNVTNLSVEFAIDVSSLMTGIQKRDEHLKSQDFFHMEKYPEISFKSTKTERTAFHSCKVYGDITIHGVSRPLSIDVDILGPVKSPFGETSIGLTGKTTLNREDFGMAWNEPMEQDGFMVGKEVELSMDIEADLIEEPAP
jgi:polyisoprenoid-binding protein YceI